MDRFSNFINQFINLICARCMCLNTANSAIHSEENRLHQYLTPVSDIEESFYTNYFDDVEHGFFHGICAIYMSYILNDYRLDPRLVASLLLHDFLKCNGYSQETHDIELKKIFDALLPETYTHSNPTDGSETNLLIKSDRLELMRYSDWKTWVDNRLYDILNEISNEQKESIMLFYSDLRPILEYLYRNRKNIFIRHGPEEHPGPGEVHLYKNNTDTYPAQNSFMSLMHKTAYPVEIDTLPLTKCSDHTGMALWRQIQGVITHNDFIKYNGKYISQSRDHIYAVSDIPLNKWVFVYKSVGNVPLKNCNRFVENLKSLGIPVINKLVIEKFTDLSQKLQSRLIVLNHMGK